MLFRQMATGIQIARPEERHVDRGALETIVKRASSGRIYTIEVSTDHSRATEKYGAKVAQMAAMNRTLGDCRGVSREDVLRKAAALIDGALPGALPKAA